MTVSSPSLRAALSLTTADKRWMDFLVQTINETWDEAHPERPKTHGYLGSEEFIRLQFEEYLLALLSSMKYHNELTGPTSPHLGNKPPGVHPQATDIEGDPALEFNADFLELWRATPNYMLFDRLTSDALLFSIVEPRHPCSGGLGFEDIQRRLAQQVADLHLDERVREGRETLNKHLATGQKKVSSVFNSFWSDLEAMREAQRKKNEESNNPAPDNTASLEKESRMSTASPRPSMSSIRSVGGTSWSFGAKKPPAVDMSQVQATAAAAGQRATAYFNSWGSWATERRKDWQEKRSASNSTRTSPTSTPRPSLSVTDAPECVDVAVRPAIAQTRSEDASTLSRSSSRRKRFSNMIRRRDSSRDSVISTNTPVSHEESPKQASPSEPVSAQPSPYAEPQMPPPSAPPVQVVMPASDPLPATGAGEQESAPTPMLMASDRLRTTAPPEPPISPLHLDESENVFTAIDISSTMPKEKGESNDGGDKANAGADTAAAEKS